MNYRVPNSEFGARSYGQKIVLEGGDSKLPEWSVEQPEWSSEWPKWSDWLSVSVQLQVLSDFDR